jgi:hypothetical protein
MNHKNQEYYKKYKPLTSKAHMKNVLNTMKISYSESNLEEIYDNLQDSGAIAKYYACTRKQRYTTKVVATKGAYQEDMRHYGKKEWFPYKCPYNCGFYHVGSRVKGKKYINDEEFDDD